MAVAEDRHLHDFHGGSIVERRVPSQEWVYDVLDVRLEVAASAEHVLVLGVIDPDPVSLFAWSPLASSKVDLTPPARVIAGT